MKSRITTGGGLVYSTDAGAHVSLGVLPAHRAMHMQASEGRRAFPTASCEFRARQERRAGAARR